MKDLVNFLNFDAESEFKNCLPVDKLVTIEWLIVWKMVIKAHQDYTKGKFKNECEEEDDDDDLVEEKANESVVALSIVPELSVFCQVFEKFLNDYKPLSGAEARYHRLNFNHCIIVLLEIAQLNDLGDEIGKDCLQKLMKKILMEFDISELVVKEISQVMELLIEKVDKRLEYFEEIVSTAMHLDSPNEYRRTEIIDDLIQKSSIDIKVKANSLKMEMMDLKEKENYFVEHKKYGDAQKVSEKFKTLHSELMEILRPIADEHGSAIALAECGTTNVASKKATPAEVLKNLQIFYYALNMKGVKALTKPSLNIYNNFVRYNLETDDIKTRVWALKSATASSLLYEPMAREVFMVLKGQLFKSSQVPLWEALIGCIFDLLLRYSIDKMEQLSDVNDLESNASTTNRSKKGGRTLYIEDGDDETDTEDILKDVQIIQMLTHVLDNNVDIKVHKVCTIGFCKMILHGQYSTKDLISKFLISYFNPATDAEVNQLLGMFFESLIKIKKQEALHDALIPTLMTLLEAPYDSPLREVKHETVIKYVIGATRPVFCSNGLNLHNTLGLKLIELMRENPECKEVLKTFSKELPTLEFSDDPLLKKDMVDQIESLLKNINVDVRTRKTIVDFRDTLNGVYKSPLKFSSTAVSGAVEVDEDAGIPDEAEKDEDADESDKEISAEDDSKQPAMDESVKSEDDIKVQEAVVNVTLMSESAINAVLSQSSSISEPTADESSSPTSQSQLNESSICEETIKSPVKTEESEPEEVDTSEDNSVINSSLVVDEIPETPDTPKTVGRPKRNFTSKRHLELSLTLSSPLRKNPRNGASPRVMSSAKAKKTPQPAAQATPKTPKPITISSTPVSEVRTRKQAKEKVVETLTLTRSASKKLNADPDVVAERVSTRKSASRNSLLKKVEPEVPKVAEPKASKLKKASALPMPTKTSTLRMANLITSKASATTTAIPKPAAKPTMSRSSSQGSINTNLTTRTRQQAGTSRRAESTTKLAGTRPRPRWN